MLPDNLVSQLKPHLDGAVQSTAAVGGGCIANACRVKTSSGPSYFLKWGGEEVARTFAGEAAGLSALATADHPLVVPEVVAVQVPAGDAPGFLLLTWIESGPRGEQFWHCFGEGLAVLHHNTADRCGFERDNFIGRLPQENTWTGRWPAFFRTHRLEPQVAMAREHGRWRTNWNAALDALYLRLPDLLPEQPKASLLHGDLWSGNFMVAATGEAVLIDPAAYHGHREADVAMTELFGGFQAEFYDAYRAAWSLEAGYDERRDVYNLYHLINHLNHFGASYARQMERILRRYA